MRLVGQAAGKGDLGERLVGPQHERLSVAQPLADHMIVRRFAHRRLEGAAEMAGADMDGGGQHVGGKGHVDIALDMVGHAAELPSGQTAFRRAFCCCRAIGKKRALNRILGRGCAIQRGAQPVDVMEG